MSQEGVVHRVSTIETVEKNDHQISLRKASFKDHTDNISKASFGNLANKVQKQTMFSSTDL